MSGKSSNKVRKSVPQSPEIRPKIAPKRPHNHPKTTPKSSQNDPEIVPKRPRTHPKNRPKSPENRRDHQNPLRLDVMLKRRSTRAS